MKGGVGRYIEVKGWGREDSHREDLLVSECICEFEVLGCDSRMILS